MKTFKLERMTEDQISPSKKKKTKKVEVVQEETQKKKRQITPLPNDPFVALSFNYLARTRLRSPDVSILTDKNTLMEVIPSSTHGL